LGHLSDHVVDLIREGFDLAIRIGTIVGSRLVARRLADDVQMLCASPAYLAVHGVPRQPNELARHRYLAFVSANGIERRLRLMGPRGQSVNVLLPEGLRSDSGEALREWALAGEGISLRSAWDVADELRSGSLVRVLEEWRPATRGIHVVRPHRAAPRRVRRFVQFLMAQFAEVPWGSSPRSRA
jgi:DNA-binding transcriptional LysR family regulator